MSENKTRATESDVAAFLNAVTPEEKRTDALRLDRIFRDATGFEPAIWGSSIVGYGRYHYVYESGREGDYLATGFSPRNRNFSVYIMPGYAGFGNILDRIGKHKLGKSCMYFKCLADIDENALRDLIRAGLEDLRRYWAVRPA